MSTKTTINPVSRVSGFLSIEVEIDNNVITDARSSGLILFRGFEKIIQGKPALDIQYFTEKISSICSSAHSLACTIALEDALKIEVDDNSKMIRDIIHGCEFLKNHILHFYLYTLPYYINIPNIALLNLNISEVAKIPENINKLLLENQLNSIKFYRAANELLSIFGCSSHNDIFSLGGCAAILDSDKIKKARVLLSSIKDFITNFMLKDVYTLSKYYNEYFNYGIGYKNFMSYGLFNNYADPDLTYVDSYVCTDDVKSSLNTSEITENIYYTWYETALDKTAACEIKLKKNKYTWIKAPRYNGYPMEVGPLARMVLSGSYDGNNSTMDRLIARVLEAKKISDILEILLNNIKPQVPKLRNYKIPIRSSGKGLIDTPRGSLGHWLVLENECIKHYDIITPSGWNLSPSDSSGVHGVIERALIGTYIYDIKNPIEIGRILRSFDPCISCTIHVVDNSKTPLLRFEV